MRVLRQALVAHAQLLGEKLYFDSQLDNYEAIAKETVKNAFAVFGEMGLLTRVKVEGQPKKAFQLVHAYRSEEKLKALVERIHGYRWKRHAGDEDMARVFRTIESANGHD